MKDFLENFYGVLFLPDAAFDKLKENPPLFQGFLIVIFVSLLNPVLHFNQDSGIGWLIFNIFGSITSGIISWLFFASFLEILASIFKQSGKMRIFLTLSAFALIPWILRAPVELFKAAGMPGKVFSIILGLAIWFWAVYLFIMAIIKSYELSLSKALVLGATIFLAGLLAFNWIAGFFSTLFSLL